MNKKIKLNTQKNIFKIIFSIKIAVVLTFFVIYEMLLVTLMKKDMVDGS